MQHELGSCENGRQSGAVADQPPLGEQAYCSPTHDLPRFRLAVEQTSGIAAASSGARRLRESWSGSRNAGRPSGNAATLCWLAALGSHLGTIARRRVAGVLDRIYLGPDIAGALLRLLAHSQKYDSSSRCGYTTFNAQEWLTRRNG